jgi:hypothetical protein
MRIIGRKARAKVAGHTAAEAAELAKPEPLLACGVLRPGRLVSFRRIIIKEYLT